MLLYNDSNCENSESISCKRVFFDFFRAASYAIIRPLITALNVSHKMETKTSEVSLFSRYSVIFPNICLQKLLTEMGRNAMRSNVLLTFYFKKESNGGWGVVRNQNILVFGVCNIWYEFSIQ